MEQPTSSRAGPVRSASVLWGHRASPYSSHSSSAGPDPGNLTFIRSLLTEVAASHEPDQEVFAIPTDSGLRELSASSAELIPLVCAALAAIGETNAKVDTMALDIEALQTSPPTDSSAIAALGASVRDLSQRVTARARVRATPASAPPLPAL